MATQDELTSLEGLQPNEKIIAHAKARFRQCVDFESDARSHFVNDLKFANADPTNGWQWPNYLWSSRQDDPTGYKPRLTINKVRQHNLLIKNDAKKNPPGIKVNPVGEMASFKAAQAYMGLIRDIERQSRAKNTYDTAFGFAVDAGIGYIRVVTEYEDDDSFNQTIRLRRVRNPLNVYLDPDSNEVDRSDARFGFVFEDVPTEEFLRDNPELVGQVNNTIGIETGVDEWVNGDHVRVVEYFSQSLKKDRLVLMIDPDDTAGKKRVIARWSKIPPNIKAMIEANKSIIQEREVQVHEIMWYKIAANKIIDKKKWPGKYIPIVPVVGEETLIEQRLDRKGHTRNMIDAQRMYNFWTSKATEQVALQTNSRWFVPVGATENLETYYQLMNRQNYPFIPYNAVDSEGNPLPPPTPIEPPTMADGFIKGMLVAKDELNMSSGQREENQGDQTNAMSFKAINARQQPGEVATYHFKDGLATALVQVGFILLDLIPHIYDTKQVRRILARDGTEMLLQIDPNAEQPYTEVEDAKEGEAKAVLNPNLGRYWVSPDVGAGYETQRKEAWNAFVQITAQNQELVTQIGDLMFRYADFPGADEIAERLRRLVPPNVLGEGPSPDLQAAQAANEELKKLVAELTDKLAKQELQLADKQDQKEINQFKADSDRLKQAGNAVADLGEGTMRPLIEKIIREMMGAPEPVVGDARRGGDGQAPGTEVAPGAAAPAGGPPVPGARQAADGQWYVERNGGHYRVEPNG